MKESTPAEIETLRIYKRFYAALQLRDLCSEMPVHAVARKYDLPRGKIQNLSQACHGFAAGMIRFCERMGWGALAAVLDHFLDRLKAGMSSFSFSYLAGEGKLGVTVFPGAKANLLALAKISFIKSRTARVFWDNGYKTVAAVAAVAAADPKDILPVLLLASFLIRWRGIQFD